MNVRACEGPGLPVEIKDVEVDETATRITIGVWVERPKDWKTRSELAGPACGKRHVVSLDNPLGNRDLYTRLRDGSVKQVLPPRVGRP